MEMPSNPYILLSVINTKLRDDYSSLKTLCEEEDLSEKEIISLLKSIDYTYDEKLNKFV